MTAATATLEAGTLYSRKFSFLDGNKNRINVEAEITTRNGYPEFTSCSDTGQGKYKPANDAQLEYLNIWDTRHLNGMHAGCTHQRALGWGNGKDIALTPDTMTGPQCEALTKIEITKAEQTREKTRKIWKEYGPAMIQRIWEAIYPKKGKTVDEFNAFSVAVRGGTHAPKIRDSKIFAQFKTDLAQYLVNCHRPEPVQSQIFKDSLSAPCPECGYQYGTAWKREDLPADFKITLDRVIDEIEEAEEERKAESVDLSTLSDADALEEIAKESGNGVDGDETEFLLALAKMFDLNLEDVNEIDLSDWESPQYTVDVQGTTYSAGTDEEMNEAWDQELDSYIDECMEMDEQTKKYFDREKWKKDARVDGRGHALNRYNGGEESTTVNGTTYFAYRQ